MHQCWSKPVYFKQTGFSVGRLCAEIVLAAAIRYSNIVVLRACIKSQSKVHQCPGTERLFLSYCMTNVVRVMQSYTGVARTQTD